MFRYVCIALLSDENLRPDHSVFWMTSFQFVKKVISGVDYKGVREIMKVSKILLPIIYLYNITFLTQTSSNIFFIYSN